MSGLGARGSGQGQWFHLVVVVDHDGAKPDVPVLALYSLSGLPVFFFDSQLTQ